MRKNPIFTLIFLFGSTMLLILVLAVGILVYSMTTERMAGATPVIEYQYVYVTDEQESDSPTTESGESTIWLAKTHEGKIGIFRMDGSLFQVIETNVKSLPKADRSMLEEGVYIRNEQELRSFIEDYSD